MALTGRKYGLELHAGKFQLIQARTDVKLRNAEGDAIGTNASMKYLGCTLWSDGRVHTELALRLGCAWADFQKMVQLWRHTSLSLAWKLHAFNAIIVSQVS